jgi:TetR/AcrR family transcriptional regulator, transcriptional repressor for nem operon
MGRHRAFDRDLALERAMDVFWTRGYENTSITHLLAAMGIQRFSLYATFGGKQDLFIAALKLYRARWGAMIADHISESAQRCQTMRWTLVELLRLMGCQTMSDDLGRGCLIANSAMELRYLDAESAGIVRGSLEGLLGTFERLVAGAVAEGERASGTDPPHLARFLVAAVNGIRDAARAGGTKQEIHDLVETLISTALPGKDSSCRPSPSSSSP